MKFGLIFALDEEINAFLKFADIFKEYKIFDLLFYECEVGSVKCVCVRCGIGKVNAARCTQILIDNMDVDYVINIGVAGGVSNTVDVLDIVVGDRLVQHDFDITAFNHEKGYVPDIGVFIECDSYLVMKAHDSFRLDNCNMKVGTIASGDIFVSESVMGRKINDKFSALCVEMEGASIAQVCHLCHIPFLVIRSISDSPNGENNITYEKFLDKSSKNAALFLKNILEKF